MLELRKKSFDIFDTFDKFYFPAQKQLESLIEVHIFMTQSIPFFSVDSISLYTIKKNKFQTKFNLLGHAFFKTPKCENKLVMCFELNLHLKGRIRPR